MIGVRIFAIFAIFEPMHGLFIVVEYVFQRQTTKYIVLTTDIILTHTNYRINLF